MTHYESLWQVGIKVEQGVEKLAKIENGKVMGSGGSLLSFSPQSSSRSWSYRT